MGAALNKNVEPGSRVLREFMEKRAVERAIAQRSKSDMRRAWTDNFAGISTAGFAGAGINRLTQSLANWSAGINADLDGNLGILRARARQLCQNNEFGRRFLSLVAGNVIGKVGPTLQVRALDPQGKLDTAANGIIETAYNQWRERCDVRGMLSLAQIEQISIKGVARDGEALIRFVRNRDLPNGIGLQLLEADRIDDQLNRTLDNGNDIRMGIEVNSQLRPVACWIKTTHPGDTLTHRVTGAGTERVPIDQLLHIYLPERAEQVRGYTWMHAVILRMAMLHAYEEAAVVAARVGAAKMGVFTRKEGTGGAIANQVADGVSAGIPQISAEAGEFFELPEGYTLESWNPEYPHANFDSFLKACFGGVATGLNVATHNLTGDMTQVNYSSARIAELSERDMWELMQEWWISAVSRRIYNAWLESALIRGDIKFPKSGKALPADKLQKFAEAARFQGRRWQWVDPVKDIEAAEREIALNIRSRTEVAASRGRDFEDVIAELAQENAALTAAGLPTTIGKTPAPAPQPVETPAAVADKAADKSAQRQLTEALTAHLKREPAPVPAPQITVPVQVNVPESITHTVEVDDLRAIAEAVNRQSDSIHVATEQMQRSSSAMIDAADEIIDIQSKPRQLVTDAQGNPIGTRVVNSLET